MSRLSFFSANHYPIAFGIGVPPSLFPEKGAIMIAKAFLWLLLAKRKDGSLFLLPFLAVVSGVTDARHLLYCLSSVAQVKKTGSVVATKPADFYLICIITHITFNGIFILHILIEDANHLGRNFANYASLCLDGTLNFHEVYMRQVNFFALFIDSIANA